jgi:hypothetical protein
VIDYLEQLERDLVDAVDRRATQRRAPRPRRLASGPAWAIALALLAVVVATALVARGTERERTLPAQPGAPVTLRLAGDLTRLDASTWSARARGPGGIGRLTLTAGPGLVTPHPRTLVPYTWTIAGGSLSGCIAPAIHRSPDGRIELNSLAPITEADGALRRFRGGTVRIAGRARTASTGAPRLPLGSGGSRRRSPPSAGASPASCARSSGTRSA